MHTSPRLVTHHKKSILKKVLTHIALISVSILRKINHFFCIFRVTPRLFQKAYKNTSGRSDDIKT
jgi:hypothetical protein